MMRFPFLCKLAGLALARSWRATAVLSLMVVSAVASLVCISALAVGTNDAMIRNSTGLFSGHIAVDGLDAQSAAGLKASGVGTILLRSHRSVLLKSGHGFEPVELIGIEPERERGTTAFWKKTVVGSYPVSGRETIFLSQAIAQNLQVGVGDQIDVTDRQADLLMTVTVVGLYRTGLTRFDHGLAFCPAEMMAAVATSQSAGIFVPEVDDLEETVKLLQVRFPAARFAAWSEFMPDLKQLIDLDNICMGIVVALVFAIVSIGISCTFLIFSLKNLREHGIMKAMGMLSSDTALLLLAQIGMMTVVAALAGTGLGALLVGVLAQTGIDISQFTSHNQYFAVSGILYPRLTMPALLAPPLTAMTFGLLASFWPIAYIVSRQPAEILRSV